MTEAEARDRLSLLVASSTFPTLTPDELGMVLASARLLDVDGYEPEASEMEWAASTAYLAGDLVVPTVRDGWVYQALEGGTSDDAEPAWTTGEIVDGTVTWEIAYAGWIPTYDMARAAADAWEAKAAKVTDRASFGADGGQFQPQQVFEHCMKMAEAYRAKIVETVMLNPGIEPSGSKRLQWWQRA